MAEAAYCLAAERAAAAAGIQHRPAHRADHHRRHVMSRDTYNIPGQAGAVGPGAHAHDNTFQQIQAGGIDLPKLAEELGRLRTAMKGEATGRASRTRRLARWPTRRRRPPRAMARAALRTSRAPATGRSGSPRRSACLSRWRPLSARCRRSSMVLIAVLCSAKSTVVVTLWLLNASLAGRCRANTRFSVRHPLISYQRTGSRTKKQPGPVRDPASQSR